MRPSRPQLQYHLCGGALHLCGLVLIFVDACATIKLWGYVGALREASCIYFDVLRAVGMLDTY